MIDAHHHFVDPVVATYPWLTERYGALRGAFGPSELLPLLVAQHVTATIVVEARESLDESRFLLACAPTTSFVRGVVAWVDLIGPGVADDIARLRGAPGGERLVGIRDHARDRLGPNWLGQQAVRLGLKAVRDADLAFDLLIEPQELPAALELGRALPDLRLVIDHVAKPPILSRALEPWAGSIAAFRGLPNVWCKVSGMVTEAAWGSWCTDDLRPYADHALETFGPNRLLFGSDWPVCLVAASYGQVLSTAQELFRGLSADERASIFCHSAESAYRLRACAVASIAGPPGENLGESPC